MHPRIYSWFACAILFLSAAASTPASGQTSLPPAFGCYRSFVRQPEMARIFSQELGVKTRCFCAANTINRLAEAIASIRPSG